jgi:VIT1/CCC1 family predicted Fe2+/Mn2+ transporter
MKISIRKGLGFGLTSGIITTLGLIVGLNSGTHSRLVVLSGILVIAIADAFSDSLAIHISEESGRKNKKSKEIWESTFSTLLFKFLFALLFIIPILMFELRTAVIASVVFGMILIFLFSYIIAKHRGINPYKSGLEHLSIAILVMIITNFVGKLASKLA